MLQTRSVLALNAAALAMALAGCSTMDINQSLARANTDTARFTQGNLALAQDDNHAEPTGAADDQAESTRRSWEQTVMSHTRTV